MMVKLINAGELAEAQEHIAHLEASYDRQTAGMRHHIERADKAEESMKVEQAAHREMSAVAAERTAELLRAEARVKELEAGRPLAGLVFKLQDESGVLQQRVAVLTAALENAGIREHKEGAHKHSFENCDWRNCMAVRAALTHAEPQETQA